MADVKYLGKCILIEDSGKKALVVGDLHLGYESTFGGVGRALAEKMFEERVKEFDRIFEAAGKVDRIILLGDIKHGFTRAVEHEWSEVRRLMEYLLKKLNMEGRILILKGNHDNYLENMFSDLKKSVGDVFDVAEFFSWKGVGFVHGDSDNEGIWSKEIKFVVCGHIHPVINLEEGAKRERYKVFMEGEIGKGLKRKKIIVVPSFVEDEKGIDVREIEKEWPWKVRIGEFGIRVVGENLEVLDFGKIRNLN